MITMTAPSVCLNLRHLLLPSHAPAPLFEPRSSVMVVLVVMVLRFVVVGLVVFVVVMVVALSVVVIMLVKMMILLVVNICSC